MGFATAFTIKDASTSDLLGHTITERTMSRIDATLVKRQQSFYTFVWGFTTMAYLYHAKLSINIARN
jgi:hypothetical protein